MSTQLPYRLELDHRRAIIVLLPDLNEVPWADIERVGTEIISKIQQLSSPHVVVDLCELNYMGSAQVALVVRMFKTVKEKNGKMVVANRDPMVQEVLSLAGLNKVWTIVESRERAVSMLGGGKMSSGGGAGGGGEASPLPGMVALVAAVVAAVFAVIHFANPALIPSRGDVFGILGGAVAAFLAGLWTMNSGNKNLGIGVLVVSVGLLLLGVYEIARPAAATQGAPAEEPADGEPASEDESAKAGKGDGKSAGEAKSTGDAKSTGEAKSTGDAKSQAETPPTRTPPPGLGPRLPDPADPQPKTGEAAPKGAPGDE